MMLFFGQAYLLAALVLACGDDGVANGSNAEGVVSSCDACSDNQVCLRTNEGEVVIECVSMPDECSGTAHCFDQTCAAALYAMCGPELINTGPSGCSCPSASRMFGYISAYCGLV